MMIKTGMVIFAAFTLLACAPTSKVVSPGAGPTIEQAQAEPSFGPKRRIAVKAFTVKTARGGGRIGQGMTEMLTDALFKSGRFIVLERQHLEDVMEEQDLGASGRISRDTAAPTGQIEGAELIVRGAVTQFEPRCGGASLLFVGAVNACVTINLRIIDAHTGRIVNATTVEGNSSSGGVGLIFATSPMPVIFGGWQNTPMEQAIRHAIDTAVHHIAKTKI